MYHVLDSKSLEGHMDAELHVEYAAYCQIVFSTSSLSLSLTGLDPIDLTGDGDQDLQKALALSLQDMNHSSGAAAISLEEQELSR